MENTRKILFIKPAQSSFIQQDEEILNKHFRLKVFFFSNKKGLGMIASQLRLFFWLCFKIWSAKSCVVWFADYHSFLPALFCRLTGKPCNIIIGGYDAESDPALKYGALCGGLRKRMTIWSLKLAAHLWPVSHYTLGRLKINAGPHLEKKCTVIPNGVKTEMFYPLQNPEPRVLHKSADPEPVEGPVDLGNTEPRTQVLCVALADNEKTYTVKGVDFFSKLSALLPEFTFAIIGLKGEAAALATKNGGKNLIIHGPVTREELIPQYRKSNIICIFSKFESFGMVMAEGMLCGCIPITFTGLGSAELIDESCGIILKDRQPEKAIEAIRALASNPDSPDSYRDRDQMATAAREKIIKEFSLNLREQKILKALAPPPRVIL